MSTDELLERLMPSNRPRMSRLSASPILLFVSVLIRDLWWYLSGLFRTPYTPASSLSCLFGAAVTSLGWYLLWRTRSFEAMVLDGRTMRVGKAWSFDLDEVVSAEVRQPWGVLSITLRSGLTVEGFTHLPAFRFIRRLDVPPT